MWRVPKKILTEKSPDVADVVQKSYQNFAASPVCNLFTNEREFEFWKSSLCALMLQGSLIITHFKHVLKPCKVMVIFVKMFRL